MKLRISAGLLLQTLYAAGQAHSMGDDGMAMPLGMTDDNALFDSDATYAVVADKEAQTLTATTIGSNTFASATVPAEVDVAGSFCFNPTKLNLPTLLRTFGTSKVNLSVNGSLLNVFCGSLASESIFPGLSEPMSIEPFEMGKALYECSLPTQVFLDQARNLKFTTLPEGGNDKGNAKILKGIHLFETAKGVTRLVSTDYYRATRTDIDLSYSSGKIDDGLSISTKVLTACEQVSKLIDKDDLAEAKTTITVGAGGDRYFICMEYGQTKVCLQSFQPHGKYPVKVKGKLYDANPTIRFSVPSLLALLESIKPIVAWASTASEDMAVLLVEPSQLRVAFKAPMGHLAQTAVAASSPVKTPTAFCINLGQFYEVVHSLKELGKAQVTFNVWVAEGASPKIVVQLPLNPGYIHVMTGMTAPPSMDIYALFEMPAPKRVVEEKAPTSKQLPAAAAEKEKPATRKTAKKGGTKTTATKPAETKPPATKTTATKPAETKPPATKTTATKPAETKPPATKTTATKPAETKPPATKS